MNMLARWNLGNGLVPATLHGVDDLMRAFFGQLDTDFSPETMMDCTCSTRMEIETDQENITAKLPIPGCKADDIEVEVVGEDLTVRAKREFKEIDDEKSHYLRRERATEEFEETVKLPHAVKGVEAKAQYNDGVLTITIPLEKEEKPRTHTIRVN